MLNEQQNMALHRLHKRIMDIVVKQKSVFVACATDPEGYGAFWYTIGFYRVGFELFGTTTSVKEMNAIASALKIDLCDANYEEPNWEPKDVLLLLTVAKKLHYAVAACEDYNPLHSRSFTSHDKPIHYFFQFSTQFS